MYAAYKKKIGFTGVFLIEPKPKEPSKHQYDYGKLACVFRNAHTCPLISFPNMHFNTANHTLQEVKIIKNEKEVRKRTRQ